MPVEQYYILEGVRRCVVARNAGRIDIPAILERAGYPDREMRVHLDCLHSPKPIVYRNSRYLRDVEYPTAVLGTEPPPISIEPLGAPGQKPVPTPLAAVKLV